MPTVTVEVAFATNPGETPVWTDVSEYLREFSTHRGRTGELDRYAAGRATIVLANEDRRFDPTYVAGPYYPNVVPMRRVRIRATWAGTTYDVFNGYVDGWSQTFEHPSEARVTVAASDAFKVLANIDLPPSAYAAEVTADGPTSWWRLGDPAGSTEAIPAAGTARLTAEYTPTFGVAGLTVRDADTAVSFSSTTGDVAHDALLGGAGVFPAGTGPLSVELIFSIADLPIYSYLFHNDLDFLRVTPTGGLEAALAGGNVTTTITGLRDGSPHHLVLLRTAANVIKLYVDGIDRTAATVTAAAAINSTVFRIGWASGATIDEVAFYRQELSAARIAAHSASRATAWSGETSGARVNRLLDAAGWPATDRSIDTGVAILQGANLGGSVLAALQKVEETEQGRLFVTDDGKVRFIARDKLLQAPYTTSQGTFGDSGAELEYDDLVYRYDDSLIFNEAVVSRAEGTPQGARDTASQLRYLRRTRVLDGLLHTSDATSVDLANWVVAHYKEPLLRVTDLTLHPTAGNEATHFPHVLDRELAERVTVRRQPQGLGAVINQTVHIEGIEHSVSAVEWITKWNLSPADTQVYWILGVTGSSELGQTTRVGF